MRNGSTGNEVTALQRELNAAGFKITVDGWFGDATEAAIKAFQARVGLVVDGIAGPKTRATLFSREKDKRLLGEKDLIAAADRLGVDLAAIKAVNEVESRGTGFLPDGRPVILYERHKAFSGLRDTGVDYPEVLGLAQKYPNLIAEKRGGYAGGTAEWSRLKNAIQILPADVAYSACSWGLYQIMGFNWALMGYTSIDEFVKAMHHSEARQLDAFVRFIEADPALHKVLKARKWAEFARIYNGPAYKTNAYDIKLARAYERYAGEDLAKAA